MRRRLRKKKHLAEFQEFGFDVRADVNDDDPEAFVDRWIAQLDSNELAFGGRAGPDGIDGFVTRFVRGGATADDRMAIIAFLEGDEAVVHYEVGGLRDAWYGWN